MNRIEALERTWMKKTPPACRVGDLIRVHVRVIEGEKQRVQPFEGVVIGRRGGSHREMITVRKVSYGVGVERIFPIHSPFVERIEVVRSGRIRRAKLYYLRKLSGRAAKLTERESLAAPASEPVGSVVDATKVGAETAKVGAGVGGRTPS
ncbi:MAG: 50S ribosomal protein L19 [Nitrospirae bacterium]|nr:50S ribosomal protein L19 [Nitrospirota bacterium]